MSNKIIRTGDIQGQGIAIGENAEAIVNNVNNYIQQALSEVDETEKARLLDQQKLAKGVRDYAAKLLTLAADSTDALAGGPYRGLIAYTIKEAELFFGRDQAIEDLLNHLKGASLTVLQAESGAGKTSLLQAGIMPRLLAEGSLPVVLRPYNKSPGLKVRQVLMPNLAQTSELKGVPLRDFLRKVTDILGPHTTLYLMLDQFEEFFTLLSDSQVRDEFINDLAECIEDSTLNVRWLIALRREFFGDLVSFRPRIPNPLDNDYRLNRLTPDEAREVITEPARLFDIEYEDALVNELLQELIQDDGEISPAHIQLTCAALYSALREQQKIDPATPKLLTLDMYQEGGGVRGILGNHLNRVLHTSLPSRQERDLARLLLLELVSSDQRRIRLAHSELIRRLSDAMLMSAGASGTIDRVLAELIDNRLVTSEKDEHEDEATYELAHDYLLSEIQLDPTVRAQKAAQELLDQEVEAWRANNSLRIAEEKLDFIDPQLPNLSVSPDADRLLDLSRKTIGRRRRLIRLGVGAGVIGVFVAVIAAIFASGSLKRAENLQITAAAAESQVQAAKTTATSMRGTADAADQERQAAETEAIAVRETSDSLVLIGQAAETRSSDASTREAQAILELQAAETEAAIVATREARANSDLSNAKSEATAVANEQATAVAEFEDIRKRTAASAAGLLLVNGRPYCTAAVLPERYLITADYCAYQNAQSVSLRMGFTDEDAEPFFYDINPEPAEMNRDLGYAIFSIHENSSDPAFAFGSLPMQIREPEIGETAFFAGYGDGNELRVSEPEDCNTVSDLDETWVSLEREPGSLEIDERCIGMRGGAGGPVFAEKDFKVLGIYYSREASRTLRFLRFDEIMAQSEILRDLSEQ